ncbi:MAG: hypothetical protein U9N35_07590 [Euryarchaeota archaeon]|nr:hypothetical protein [Euryarchaeota archaeon]
MNLKETLIISLENYVENIGLVLPFVVPTGFITGFIYLTDLDIGLSPPSAIGDIPAALRDLSVDIRTELVLVYGVVYLLLMVLGIGIDIGYIKKEIVEQPSLAKGTRESYPHFLTMILLSVFYFLITYLLFSLMSGVYFYGSVIVLTLFFLYTFPSIVIDGCNFIPSLFLSTGRVLTEPVKAVSIYLLSLLLLLLSLVSAFYDILYFPIFLMVFLPLIANFITLSYVEKEEGVECPECGGVLEEHEGTFKCAECGAEYVYE